MQTRWRRLGLTGGWTALAIWIPMSIRFTNDGQRAHGGDFGMYYAAAETLRFSPHADVYLRDVLAATVMTHGGCGSPPTTPYPYQPLLAIFLEPMTLLPCSDAATIWMVVNFILWFGLAGLLSLLVWRRYGAKQALVVAALTLAFRPVLAGIYLGQIHLIILVLMVVGVALIERQWELAGGAALGLGFMLKYLPGIIVLYFLLRGRWKVAAGAGVVSVGFSALEYVLVGPHILLESFTAGAADVRYYAQTNQHGHWMSAIPGGVAIAYGLGIVFVVLVVWRSRRVRSTHHAVSPKLSDRLAAYWAVVTLLLISPLTWWFYMTWLLPAYLVAADCLIALYQQYQQHRGIRRWRALLGMSPLLALFVLSYGLIEIPVYVSTVAVGALGLWLLCGVLFLWGAGVRWPRTLAPRQTSAQPSIAAGAT